MDFDCSRKEIDNKQPSDGLTKMCKRPMVWNGKCDTSHANTIFWKIGATKFVLLSSKRGVSRGLSEKNLLKKFSEPLCDGASLFGLSVIIPLAFLNKKYPSHVL